MIKGVDFLVLGRPVERISTFQGSLFDGSEMAIFCHGQKIGSELNSKTRSEAGFTVLILSQFDIDSMARSEPDENL